MTRHELGKAKDKDLVTSVAAMKRAAAMARKAAVQTDTAIVVVQDNKIVRRTSKELRISANSDNPQIPINGEICVNLRNLRIKKRYESGKHRSLRQWSP